LKGVFLNDFEISAVVPIIRLSVIPVKNGATRTIPKLFSKYLNNTPGNDEIKKIQKATLLSTAYIGYFGKY
jgi:hypothetical protein